MKTLTLTSNAKVNLALDILGREQQAPQRHSLTARLGSPAHSLYHFIQTIFHEITPQNTHNFKPDLVTIRVEEAPSTATQNTPPSTPAPQITILCEDPSVPTDKSNLAYKAAKLMIRQQLTWRGHHVVAGQPVTITIEKHIPVSQGLGGGSSNAAATLRGLDKLFDLNLNLATLKSLAAEIGMDVPFFIEGGIALGEHFGEQITPLPPVNGLAFTLFPGPPVPSPHANPGAEKTRLAYAALDLSLCGKNTAKTEALIHAIKTNDALAIHPLLHNDFETLPEYTPTNVSTGVPTRSALPENHHLTGAGPGYFLVS